MAISKKSVTKKAAKKSIIKSTKSSNKSKELEAKVNKKVVTPRKETPKVKDIKKINKKTTTRSNLGKSQIKSVVDKKNQSYTEQEKITQNELAPLPTNAFKIDITSRLRSINPWYIVGACIFGMGLIYFLLSDPSSIKNENKKLKNEIKALTKERDIVRDSINTLSIDFKAIKKSDSLKTAELSEINKNVADLDKKISSSTSQLNKVKGGLDNINSQIRKVSKSPEKKVGDKLLNSLKSKLNQN